MYEMMSDNIEKERWLETVLMHATCLVWALRIRIGKLIGIEGLFFLNTLRL